MRKKRETLQPNFRELQRRFLLEPPADLTPWEREMLDSYFCLDQTLARQREPEPHQVQHIAMRLAEQLRSRDRSDESIRRLTRHLLQELESGKRKLARMYLGRT